MKFSEKVKVVKEKVGDNILFVENGNFYIAIGKDACFLNSKRLIKYSIEKPQVICYS